MTQNLDERIEDYLSGNLSEEETQRFEEELLEEDIAAEFREILFMRELLRDLPPESPPPGLVERIENSLALERSREEKENFPEQRSKIGQIADAFRWGFSWPVYAFSGISHSSGAMKDSISGINSVSYSLGPLREPARNTIRTIFRPPKKPLWKIVLSRLW